MSGPLVTVTVPTYNARATLPWALSSVLAQTVADWELLLIDDDSRDHPEEIVRHVNDPRIRYIRLPDNRGRGYARQVGLDNVRGEFIAMLDADDWMYPNRLEVQVAALRADPDLTLVSAGMAIVDAHNDIVGVRGTGTGQRLGPHRGVNCPVVHAASMYRRSHIDGTRFDATMRFGEDQDFLVALLQGRRYAILPDVVYVYSELESVSALKAARSQRYVRRQFRKYLRQFPAAASKEIATSLIKEAAYRAAAISGRDQWLVARRSRSPTAAERSEFERARGAVQSCVGHTFPAIAAAP